MPCVQYAAPPTSLSPCGERSPGCAASAEAAVPRHRTQSGVVWRRDVYLGRQLPPQKPKSEVEAFAATPGSRTGVSFNIVTTCGSLLQGALAEQAPLTMQGCNAG